MSEKNKDVKGVKTDTAVADRIAAAAARALAEAEARHKASPVPDLPPEKGGRAGPEPTRFGDWEKKGIICDF